MRVLFVTFGSPSHFYPMVPLAWALRSAGHEVRVAHPPGFTATVAASGLLSHVAGRGVDLAALWTTSGGAPAASSPAGAGVRAEEARRSLRAVEMFTRVADSMAEATVALARWWRPDFVVYEPRAYAGPLAAAATGVPAVRHLYGTDYTYGRWPVEREVVEPFFQRHSVRGADPAGAATIDPCPAFLQLPSAPRRYLMRYVPYNGPGVQPRWLLGPKPRKRVCVTWGTTSGMFMGHLRPVHDVIAAATVLSASVVVAVRAADRPLLGDVPAGVAVLEDTPLHLVLPHCDAIAHQGGAGTTLTSLVCAVPQLVLPAIADQFVNGGRVAGYGAGRCVNLSESTVDSIAEALADLLAVPGYRARAAAGSAEAGRQPAPAQLVAALEAAAQGGAVLDGAVLDGAVLDGAVLEGALPASAEPEDSLRAASPA